MNAYKTTSVPVERSKESIRQLLIKFGARGVQFAEDFSTRQINVRFAKDVDGNGNLKTVSVTMIVPEPPQKKKRGSRRRWNRNTGRYEDITKTDDQRSEQMYRATYRALHYWLKSNFEAVEFGLLSFEDVFLSHFEWMVNGRRGTVGELVKPHLMNGLQLAAPKSEVVIGEIVE
jgi:hypothetical protein